MIVWATEFPLAEGSGCGDVLGVAKGTLAASPHTPWQAESFGDDPINEIKRLELDGQFVAIGRAESESGHIAGLQHRWVENAEREWTTEVVGHESNGNTVVSVRLNCHLLLPGLTLPAPKKPYVVRRILEDLGGGEDFGLTVQNVPHRLAEPAVDNAARLVTGTSGVRLPVVYVSAGRLRLEIPGFSGHTVSGICEQLRTDPG